MWIYIVTSFIFLGIGLILLLVDSNNTKHRMELRFQSVLPLTNKSDAVSFNFFEVFGKWSSYLSNLLGFDIRSKWIGIYLVALLTISFISYLYWSFKYSFVIAVALIVVTILLIAHRRNKYRQLIISQIPLFIDQLIRSLSTGRGLESAWGLVVQDTPKPLGTIFNRVVRATDLGAGFTESLVKEVMLTRIKELQTIALSVKISNSYGTSPKEMLNSVMQLINNQDQARRELSALTGETKISALVLMSTPVSILLYMIFTNPGYLEMMTSNPTGLMVFWTAIGMQLFGAFLFWRMLRTL